MGTCPIPISLNMHPELRDERSDRHHGAAHPSVAIILQASPLTPVRLAVIGVAEVSQCLHSVTVVESSSEVLLRAFVSRDSRPGRSSEFDYIVRRVLWVVEVELDSPLGTRAVVMDSLSEASPGDYDCIPLDDSHIDRNHTLSSPSAHA